MDTVSTAGLSAANRMAAWNDLYSSRMSRVEFTPVDRHNFDAELSIRQLGPVKLARLHLDRCRVERQRRHLSHSPRLYSFLLQARGRSVFQHYGHEARLCEGDFVLCDTGMPHSFETHGPSITFMVRVAPEVAHEFLPTLERFCGLHLRRGVGVTGTAAAMVQSLADGADFRSHPGYEVRVARSLLEILSISYTMGFQREAPPAPALWRRRNDVIRYIEDHLREPSLSAAAVADGVHISQRYLRAIFAEGGEKVSDYIRRRRVEECARKMRDPAWNGHSLMQIAFSCGFNSAAHFSRCFSDRFSVSPREYRRAPDG